MTIPKKDKVKTFENYLFEYLFKNGKIVVIFDGYDEVGTKYRKMLISWILRLKNKTANQIWICSRSCFKEELEKELATSSFSLKILSNYDQETIMRNIWENHWQGEMTETEKSHMDLYMITLITKFSKTLEDNEKYAGCPLHIIMLADVFMENKEPGTDWEGCFDFMKNNNSCTRYSCLHTSDRNFIPTKLEHLYSLYEKFVMQKIKKHFFEDKGIFGSTRDMVECYKNKEFLKFKKMHEMLAVRFLGEDAKFNEIFEESGKEKLQKWLKQFGTHDAGIIDTTATSSHPIFIHSNYAEYFAACCLIDIVQTKKELVLKFIYDILQNDVIVFSHCAKNLLAEKYENYGVSGFVNDVKTVSTLNEKERYFLIKWFMDDEKIENKLPKIDTTGKTYLHCAVASEISETVVYVLLHTYAKLITRNEGIGDDVLSHIIRSEEALFLLSEYVSLKDDNEMTAVMYSSNPDITNLLNEILKIGQNSTKPKEYANNIKTIIIEKPVKIKMISTSLEYLRKNDKIYYNNCYPLAWKLSFESLKTILTHSSADILINMLQCTATNFTIFDVICNRTDFDDEERLNLFKCWWDNQLIKDLSKQQEAGNCILIAAVENDNVELFNYFLNFLLSDSFVFSVDAIVKCFSAACGANILRFVKLLYENYPAEISNCLPLHLATENNANLKIIEYICTHINPDINSINEKKEVALIQLMKRDFEYYKIKYFLEHGANVNIVDRMNVYSAWNYAFRSYDDDIIKLFLDCENLEILESELCLKTMKEYYQNEDFCVDIKVDNTFRLFEAIINRDTTLVLFLIWKNGDVNVEDEYGKTALHYACETAEEKIVRILIYNGTMFDKADIFEKKPIEYCGENKRNITLLSDIEWAFNNINNPDVTKNHTSRYHFLNSFIRNKDGDTLLHLMAKNKINDSYNDIIRKYFSGFYEITLNVRNVNGNTVLHFVAEQNNLNFVKELLENGAYYNMLNNFGKTPEDLAPKNGHVKNLLHSVEHLFNIADSDNTAEIGLSIIKVLSFFENNKLCLHKLRNNEGQALLHRIILNTNEDHARSVVRYLHTPEPVYEEIMISLIQQNKSKHVKEMMNAGTFFNIRMFNLLKDKESNECVKQFAKIAELFDLAHKENIDGLKEILDNTKFELDVVNIYSTFANYRQPENLTSLRGPFYRIYRILEFIIRTSNYHMIEHLLKMGSKVHVDFDRVKNKKTRQLLTLYASFKKNI